MLYIIVLLVGFFCGAVCGISNDDSAGIPLSIIEEKSKAQTIAWYMEVDCIFNKILESISKSTDRDFLQRIQYHLNETLFEESVAEIMLIISQVIAAGTFGLIGFRTIADSNDNYPPDIKLCCAITFSIVAFLSVYRLIGIFRSDDKRFSRLQLLKDVVEYRLQEIS